MLTNDFRHLLEKSSLQLTVNWFLGACYSSYLTQGAFFNSLLGKQYTIDEIKLFARAFGIYRCKYPKLLGIDVILSSFEREEWKSSAYHLLEELGGGRGSKTHGELYGSFLNELGLTVQPGFVVSEMEEPAFVTKFYGDFEEYCRNRSTVERKTILAIFELVDNADYASMYNGLRLYGVPQSALIFFKIHAEASHWEDSKEEIEDFWADESNRLLMIGAFEYLLRLQQNLYEGLHHWITKDRCNIPLNAGSFIEEFNVASNKA